VIFNKVNFNVVHCSQIISQKKYLQDGGS